MSQEVERPRGVFGEVLSLVMIDSLVLFLLSQEMEGRSGFDKMSDMGIEI